MKTRRISTCKYHWKTLGGYVKPSYVTSQPANGYITTYFLADMVQYPQWLWSPVTQMWEPQILQLSSSIFLLFSFFPSLHICHKQSPLLYIMNSTILPTASYGWRKWSVFRK